MKPILAELLLLSLGTVCGGLIVAAAGILFLDSLMSSEMQTQKNADEIWEESRRRKSQMGPRSLTRRAI